VTFHVRNHPLAVRWTWIDGQIYMYLSSHLLIPKIRSAGTRFIWLVQDTEHRIESRIQFDEGSCHVCFFRTPSRGPGWLVEGHGRRRGGGRGECLIGWHVLDEVRGKEGGRRECVCGVLFGGRGGERSGMLPRCEKNRERVDLLGGVKCYVLLHEVGLDVDVDVDARFGEVVFAVTVGGWCWATGRAWCEEGLFGSMRVVGDGRRGRYGRWFSGL
jgi:hypothetical protein